MQTKSDSEIALSNCERVIKSKQESCAIAKITARCALYKYIVRRCGDMIWQFEIIQDGGGRHLEFIRIENSAIRSAVPENPTLEPT